MKWVLSVFVLVVTLGLSSCYSEEVIFRNEVDVSVTYSNIYHDKNGIWIEEGSDIIINSIEALQYRGYTKKMYAIVYRLNGENFSFSFWPPFYSVIPYQYIPTTPNSSLTLHISVELSNNSPISGEITEPIHIVPKGQLPNEAGTYTVKYTVYPDWTRPRVSN